MLVANKKIIVMAGVTGTGRATALKLAEEGAQVVAMSNHDADHSKVQETLAAGKAVSQSLFEFISCDAADPVAVHASVTRAVEMMAGLDGIVLGQAIGRFGSAESLALEDYKLVMDVAFYGTVHMCQAAFPYLKDAGGSIITFGALSASQGNPYYTAYNASKGAVIAYARTLAREWGPHNIRVNTIGPVVFTEISEDYLKTATPEQIAVSEKSLEAILLGSKKGFERMGHPSEVGNMITFLCSDHGKYITGQYINVDGGAEFGRF